jgi:hypothetical protein
MFLPTFRIRRPESDPFWLFVAARRTVTSPARAWTATGHGRRDLAGPAGIQNTWLDSLCCHAEMSLRVTVCLLMDGAAKLRF